MIEVVNPATEEVIGTVPAGTPGLVDAAVTRAATAFPTWSTTPVEERLAVLGRVADLITGRADAFATTMTAEMGTPATFAAKVQVPNPVAIVRDVVAAASADFFAAEKVRNSLVLREPVGVVAAITPWNFPLQQMVAKIAPALAAGAVVVLKPSELAPLTAVLLGEVLSAAGVPSGVVEIIHGTGPVVGEALASHPLVDMVSFTGSTRAGRRVSALAAETVKRVTLELGGKSANIVLADADLTRAVKFGVAGAFLNNGQACSALTRLLVPASKHDEAVGIAVAAAARHRPDDPTLPTTRLGPLVSAAQRDRVTSYIRKGVAEGARLALGGPEAPRERGHYVTPTVFADVRADMTIAQEEIFGPVLSVMPYTDEDDAVRIANSTVYGLAGAVFSADVDHAVTVAKRLRTGQVDINGAAFNTAAPFGGYRQSGNGREFGHHGLTEFTELKSIQL
ncbi:aldehyde dehydrogenase family protein [Saccharothrix violaceirubra]|uniref:aldehyde dehydrogenase (NAD(+)) n=1 Tax=Saccharothrix violaceirubra TaxID=413306 RepID=A0A7W7WYG6_9PSEU|nr:aldehyde dehydrogenase family protein [Saccharothrix violaceirubra]MBB4967981.1 aldehyde dehydrogenase (NAD+) [Saccharothrix violaceirubra]